MARPAVAVVTAVLPTYREQFLRLLPSDAGIRIYAGSEHCDRTVRTGVGAGHYTKVRNIFLLDRRIFLQRGAHLAGLGAEVAVVDLNPRSLTSWAILLGRAALRRRTMVWGHLHPRAGRTSRTAPLRRAMIRLASGVITYTWNEQTAAGTSGRPSWAATNALYSTQQLASHSSDGTGNDLLYVGRLEPSKKVSLLLSGFAAAISKGRLPADARLVLVGTGSETVALQQRAVDLGISDRVVLAGPSYDFQALSARYRGAAAAVSGGYGGLQITQSLGFGVPVVLPHDEPHAPEIELAEDYCTYWFERDSVASLAVALERVFTEPVSGVARERARLTVRTRYSADAMAEGFVAAVRAA